MELSSMKATPPFEPLIQKEQTPKTYQKIHKIRKAIHKGFFEHFPEISFEKNEKYRWINIYTFIVQKALMSVILTLPIGALFDTYTYFIFNNKNSWVGYIAGATGTTTLLAAIPIGIIVDRWNRSVVNKAAFLILIASTICGIVSVAYDLTIGLFMFAVLTKLAIEIAIAAGTTLFSDSLSISERANYIMINDTISYLAQSLGPLVSIFYFLFYGNEWEVRPLRILICASTLIFSPSMAITSYILKNVNPHMIDKAPQQQSISVSDTNAANVDTPQHNYEKLTDAKAFSETSSSVEQGQTDSLLGENTTETTHMTFEEYRFSKMTRWNKLVPLFNTTCNVTRYFGAGMLVKYTPLFYLEEFNLAPISLAWLLLFQALASAACIYLAKLFIADMISRPMTSWAYSMIGTLALIWLSYTENLPLSIFLYLIRFGFQTSIIPVDQSLVSDYTTSQSRGKWNAFFSFGQFFWSGSALFGGYLSDRYGYRTNFKITACIYMFANFLYIPVFFWVLDEDKPRFRFNFARFSKKKSKPTTSELSQ